MAQTVSQPAVYANGWIVIQVILYCKSVWYGSNISNVMFELHVERLVLVTDVHILCQFCGQIL